MNSPHINIIIRYSSLGDLVLCSALVAKLRYENPSDPLIFITKQEFKDLVSTRFPHDRMSVESTGKSIFEAFNLGYSLAKKVSKEFHSCTIFDLHGNPRSFFFKMGFRLSAIIHKLKIKLRTTNRHSFSRTLSIFFRRDLLGKRHVFIDHLNTAGGSLNFYPTLKAFDRTPRTTTRILIAPDAQHWKKRWTVAYWEILISKLLNHPRNFQLTLVGTKNCLPIDIIDNILINAQGRIENLIGQTSLENLPDIAASHDLCICTNSAWLHISEAVGTKALSLSGPIVPGFGFSPWKNNSIELGIDLPCRPCSKHGAGRCSMSGNDFHACMKNISPQDVFYNTLKILGISQ